MRRVLHVKAASFKIHFKTAEFYPLIRKVHFTEIDIFSYVGGLLGLFFGISVLSIAEVGYYLMLLGKHLRRFRVIPIPIIKVVDTEARGAWKSTKQYCLEYMESSSIHSFLFIVNSNRRTLERIVWLLPFALSITGCTFMIQKLHKKSGINAVTTAIVDGGFEITKIPFPAVTIISSYPSIPTSGDFFTFHKDSKPSDPSHEGSMFNENYFRDYEDVDTLAVHKFPFMLK
jgi:hypothetical protein